MKNFVPKLRSDLEIIPTHYEGQGALLVRDSLGLIGKPIVLQGDALILIGLIDGRKTISDIQLEFIRQKGGVFVGSEFISNFLEELDSAFLLESPRYLQGKAKLVAEYSQLPVRSASHAGQSYPEDRRKLKEYLNSILGLAKESALPLKGGKICALISPHIDLEAGKRIYASVYHTIHDLSPRRVFLLGTGHSLEGSIVGLTEKDFETPLGLVKNDQRIVRELKSAGGDWLAGQDLAFRQEHSLEFQLIFLQHLFGSDFTLVPILFGSFQEALGRFDRPSALPGLGPWLELLKKHVEGEAEKTLVVAGVDFSHIGPKFGHRSRATSLILEAKEHDRRLIEACERGDVQSFWAESRRVLDKYNVCGFSTLACLLEILPGATGRLLDYEFWQEEATQSAVSFAGMIIIK